MIFAGKYGVSEDPPQTWSDPLLVTPDVNNPVDIAVGGSASSFLHDPSSPLRGEDRGGGEGIQVASLYMLPGLLAQLSNSAFADSNGEYLYYYHNDHLGTPLFLTDVGGTVVWRGEYLPFGGVFTEDRDPDGDGLLVTQPFRFPGQYEDSETGLYYNNFRNYDPTLGRYVEADPVGLAGGVNVYLYVDIVEKPSIQTNLYLYSSADPVNLVDPYGLAPLPGYEDNWWNPGNFKFHGNWGGPGWTGGYEGSWDQLSWDERRNASCPVDNMDELFRQHDISYGLAREDYYSYLRNYPKTSGYDRYLARNRMAREFRIADRMLADGLTGINNPSVMWKRNAAAWYFGVVGY